MTEIARPEAPVPTGPSRLAPGRHGQGPLLLGVRHHGPGSARAVRAALSAARPRTVLVEGPPEADGLLALAAEKDMRPPVALLAHVVDEPGRSAFWPFAAFSPEWAAINWALSEGVPVRFVDLPAAHTLALRPLAADEGQDVQSTEPPHPEAPEALGAPEKAGGGEAGGVDAEAVRVDPLAALARAAGCDDAERWWEDMVEHRAATSGGADPYDPYAPFAALAEAMAALREVYPAVDGDLDPVREAYMRLQLRAACKEYGDEVAVVCGAWHVPALAERVTVTADRALLKGLPKVKAETTWVPWTNRRLARAGGYGAGIESPGWYGHLFDCEDRRIERWMTKVAGLLRGEDHPVSSAHVIEAVRLADALAAMRGRPLPGLSETSDAVRSVMCEGSDAPMELIRDRLVVGDVLGEVPDSAPVVPLQRDLTALQRRLRLKPEAQERELDLDLRKENDAARSRLLHRLRLLGIGWGTPAASRGTGTFRESWRLSWEPELSVRIAEAGVWGTTVESAAGAGVVAQASSASALAGVTALAEQCLSADLPRALPLVMQALAERAALDAEVGHLAAALPALARALRYGDVRGTRSEALAEVAAGLAERVFVGLPAACTALDGDAAEEMRTHLDAVHGAVALLAESGGARAGVTGADDGEPSAVRPAEGTKGRWHGVLGVLATRETVAGLLRGRCTRLLLDESRIASEEAARLMGLALSQGTGPAEAAAWIEGFVGGSSGGMLLLHDEQLLRLVDDWLCSVPEGTFGDVLPLLRRTFSAYEVGVRRSLGELLRRGPGAGPSGGGGHGEGARSGFGPGLDPVRADAVTAVVLRLLGHGSVEGGNGGHGGHSGHGGGAGITGVPEAPAADTVTGSGRAAGRADTTAAAGTSPADTAAAADTADTTAAAGGSPAATATAADRAAAAADRAGPSGLAELTGVGA